MSKLNENIDIENIGQYCDNILKCINEHLILSVALDVDQTQQFELNFIKKGVDIELDSKMELLMESMDKLEAIRQYLNGRIMKFEKASKTAKNDYVKLHETEKNSFSLIVDACLEWFFYNQKYGK